MLSWYLFDIYSIVLLWVWVIPRVFYIHIAILFIDSLIKKIKFVVVYQNMPPPLSPPRFIPRPAAPLPAPQFCAAFLFHFPAPLFNYPLSHFTFMNLHINVSSTSIIAPSLSNSDIYPGALNIVTSRLLAKNSYPSVTT